MDTLFDVEIIDVMHNESTCRDCIHCAGCILNENSPQELF